MVVIKNYVKFFVKKNIYVYMYYDRKLLIRRIFLCLNLFISSFVNGDVISIIRFNIVDSSFIW